MYFLACSQRISYEINPDTPSTQFAALSAPH